MTIMKVTSIMSVAKTRSCILSVFVLMTAAFPCVSSAQNKPALPVGMWTGAVTGTNGVTIEVSYQVRSAGDSMIMVSHSASGRVTDLGPITMSGDTMRFPLAPNTKFTCTLVRQKDATFAGECTDGKVEPAHLVITPPAADADPLQGVRASLRNIGSAQEIYYSNPANKYTYASDVAKMSNYAPEPGVTVTILEGTDKGWSGIAQRSKAAACVLWMGDVGKIPVTARGTSPAGSGMIACDPVGK